MGSTTTVWRSESVGSTSSGTTAATSLPCTPRRSGSGASANWLRGPTPWPTRMRRARSPNAAGASRANSPTWPSSAPRSPSGSCTRSWWTFGPITSTSTSPRGPIASSRPTTSNTRFAPARWASSRDLLIATARSPAMLFYLDNWESVAPGTSPPFPLSARRRGGQGVRPVPKGINENYARELLELHTLGVDGGYTQQDVIDVARIFTGWSIERPQQGGDFEFHDWAHDRGEKLVLGVWFEGGHDMDEGTRLLKLLANHPATIHHVSRKLCQRFVNDDPPDGCVDDAVAAWKRSSGDMRAVLRAIFHGPDFWAAANVRAKVKTPLEFVVSAARAVAAEPDTSPRLAQVVARLGEPLYLHVAPDGYPEREAAWVNSGALLDRMNTAVALASGKLPGVTVGLDSIVSAGDADQLIGVVNEKILSGTMSENTKQVLRRDLAGIGDPAQARALAVGLAIGGPEFQKQ